MENSDKDKKHLKYLNILKNIEIDFLPNIDLSKALYLECLYVLDCSVFSVIKVLVRTMFFKTPELDIRMNNSDLLMLTTIYGRRDHDSYWNSIKELFSNADEIILDGHIKIKRYLKNISFKGISNRISQYKHAYMTLSIIENRLHRSWLASKIVTCEKYIHEIQNHILDTKVAIAFCDTFMFENVIIQYLRDREVICITNQHGQPVFRGWEFDLLNQSQILNFTSDYFIAKGNYAKKQFLKAGFAAKRIVVLGSMNNADYEKNIDIAKNLFGVFTDCVTYDFSNYTNQKIIEIAEEISKRLNISYFIKVHPSDNVENYNCMISNRCIGVYKEQYSNDELFEQIEFGVMSASAIYLDMLYAHVKCYQMRSEIDFPIVENQDDIFESCDQFMNKYLTWSQLSVAEKKKYFEEQQIEYGICENTGDRIQSFIYSFIN